jgi:two-component system, chemotaxis family, protein-glutamate methylesterase/glutaminase
MIERQPIRVLVVDDSAVMRKLLSAVLRRDPQIEVVATAIDGVVALQKLARFEPDVVTLDLEMPRMDGLDFLRQIVRQSGPPVLVVSAHTQQGANQTLAALEMGAVDVVAKPRDVLRGGLELLARELIGKVRAVAGRRWRKPRAQPLPGYVRAKTVNVGTARRVVAIGVSTGGPAALGYLLPRLPPDLGAAVVVVQHMPEGFTAMLADRLNQACAQPVAEARDGEPLRQGHVYIAPGGRHLRVATGENGPILLSSAGTRLAAHCPSVDVLFQSVALEFGARATGVLLTGMGEDGAAGLLAIRGASGHTIAQDEESSVVFGMPKAAILRGAVQHVLSLERMPEGILGSLGYRGRAGEGPTSAAAVGRGAR